MKIIRVLRKVFTIRMEQCMMILIMKSSPSCHSIFKRGEFMDQKENVIEQKCYELLQQAIDHDASDIHLIPANNGYAVNFNRATKLTQISTLPPQLAERMILFYKFLSSLDISDKRKPQSGSFHKKLRDEKFSFRVSTIPAIHYKESVVIRIQKHNNIVPIDELCMEKAWAHTLQQAASMQQGLFLLSGPTGSGKTTTMYSLTSHCAWNLNRHVITLEDPVENKHAHLLQIQVNESAGITYSTGLKAILRHSPDVIMLGEIRDSETAKVAVSAALTGHLVFSTLHSKDPVGSIFRMMDFGVSIEELRQTIVCIAAQRLIEKNNGEMAAIFEIIANQDIEKMIESIKRGERFTYPKEQKIEALIKKYHQPQFVYEK